ncbi:MAG: precorrin-4 C(11)-methyltransferase [Thermodesulfobacteriota bacterium]
MSEPTTYPVIFVGAGPGRPDLITVAGRQALTEADLVIYAGSLVSPEMLSWARPGTELADSSGLDLEEIVAKMTEAHFLGRKAVRLHTGDPSLYGAVAEQFQALRQRGVPYRVIPGVTAAFAAAAALELEFTLPEICQTLILTRAPGRTPTPETEKLTELAASGASLAIYLSADQADRVAAALIPARGPEAPVCVVYRASWPDQRLVWTTAAGLVADLAAAGIKRQAVILAGPAVEAWRADRVSPASRLYDPEFSHGFRLSRKENTSRPAAKEDPGLIIAGYNSDLPSPLAVYGLTRPGAEIARRLAAGLPWAKVFLPARLAEAGAGEEAFDRFARVLTDNYRHYRGHLVAAAAGIVVRTLAPLLADKTLDPAVIVVDQAGRFAVSLVSGHLGRANALAKAAANILGGQAVITTATDSAGKPALDSIAVDLGFQLDNPAALPRIGRRLLEDEPVPVYDPGAWLEPHLAHWPADFVRLSDPPDLIRSSPLIWVGPEAPAFPETWLAIRPPCLFAGFGLNRGTAIEELESLLVEVFQRHLLSIKALAGLATIAAKRDEPGLAALARKLNLPLHSFSTEELAGPRVPTPSEVVARHMGVESVCEAAAMLAARTDRLLVTKQKSKNATLAVALTSSR